ncbi:TetR/AcrR family transcriptional regulator [Enterobacter mori]|uniref:TetR/AcrR family transcriptional regulator n=1 Tax=Enterobacter mori TaxID=539813 RepID=UPI00402AA96D
MQELTRNKLLKQANVLIRKKGYSSFSYADLSKSIGISKASIHYHFPNKENLGEKVVLEALKDLDVQLSFIDNTELVCSQRIYRYIEIFQRNLDNAQLPLCCILLAELDNLPESIKYTVSLYFDAQTEWLKNTLKVGIHNGEFNSDIDVQQSALMILTFCEGSGIVSKIAKENNPLDRGVGQLMRLLSA